MDKMSLKQRRLWFDVGIKRYTTISAQKCVNYQLWFDVGIKRYTTGTYLFTKPVGGIKKPPEN